MSVTKITRGRPKGEWYSYLQTKDYKLCTGITSRGERFILWFGPNNVRVNLRDEREQGETLKYPLPALTDRHMLIPSTWET